MNTRALAAAVVALAVAASPAAAHHPDPIPKKGGPKLAKTYLNLRAAAKRTGKVSVGRNVLRHGDRRGRRSWGLVRRESTRLWNGLHPAVAWEHEQRERYPYPTWFVRYSDPVVSCESGHNPRAVSGNGIYFNLFQFDVETWASNGGTGHPLNASVHEMYSVAYRTWLRRGWGPWPVCGKLAGAR